MHAGIRAHHGCQPPACLTRGIRMEGTRPAVPGHHGAEERQRRLPIAHLADDQVVRRHTHGIINPVCQGIGAQLGTHRCRAGLDGLHSRAVDPDLLGVFDLDDAPALR